MLNSIKKGPIPKYHQCRMLIEQDIRSGKYGLGSALPSEPRLAEDYGISRQTLRQALQSLEDEGYLIRQQGRGTFVAKVCGNYRNEPLNLGVVIYKPAMEAQWYFPDLLRGISDVVTADAANIIIIPFDEDTPGVQEGSFCRQIIEQKNLQGLLIAGEELQESEMFHLLAAGFPFVMIRLLPYRDGMIDYVCYDHTSGIKQAVSYLYKLGHRHIAYIGGRYSRYYAAMCMMMAFREAMAELNLALRKGWIIECDYADETAFRLAKRLLSATEVPTAIILTDDLFAQGVYEAAAAEGLKVPDDLSVTGFNDLPVASVLSPALTAIRVPRYEIGRLACQVLEGKIHGLAEDYCRELKVELVVRDSCAPCRKREPIR